MMTFRRIKIIDENKDIIYDGLVYKLPIKEEAVQRRCMEIYREACACKKRMEIIKGLLYIVLDDYFKQYEEGDAVEIMQIPDDICGILELSHTPSKK